MPKRSFLRRNGVARLLALLGGLISLLFFGVVGGFVWRLDSIRHNAGTAESMLTSRLMTTYQLSSDLNTLAMLSLQMSSRRSTSEMETTYQSILSRIETIRFHLNCLHILGIKDDDLGQLRRIQDQLADSAHTLHTVLQRRTILAQRLGQVRQGADPARLSPTVHEEDVLVRTQDSIDRRLNNLIRRQTQSTGHVAASINALSSRIHQDWQSHLQRQSSALDSITGLLFTAALAGVSVLILIVVLIRRRLLSRLTILRKAALSWQSGISVAHLPQGADELADIGRGLLDMHDHLDRFYASPQGLGRVDPQSGLLCRHAFLGEAQKIIDHLPLNGQYVHLFLGCVEFPDAIRERFGAKVHDQLLCHMGRLWAAQAAFGGEGGRLDSDEFAVLIPGLTPHQGEQVRCALQDQRAWFPAAAPPDLTQSVSLHVGVAALIVDVVRPTVETLYAQADTDLTRSRRVL